MTLLTLLAAPADPVVLTPGRPTVAQVAAILRARTRGPASRDATVAGEHGTFDATTRPTYEQVEELIDLAVGELAGMMGGRTPCSAALLTATAASAAYRAAMLVEISYFPEQTNGDQTAFKALMEMWKTSSTSVAAMVKDLCPLPGVAPTDQAARGVPIGRVPLRVPTTWAERW